MPRRRAPRAPTRLPFKAALAQASTTEVTEKTAEVKLRKGEEAQAVDGHAYSEITKGARAGMYVNTSGNVRHGQTFVLVNKDGKEYHIYGTGKDRLVVGFHMPVGRRRRDRAADTTAGPKADTSDLKLRKNEKIEPVEGHAYAEITSGAREGMYINTSGNKRHGDAFVLVNKLGVEYHIYGTGADREVIALKQRDERRRVVLTARRSAPPSAPAGSRRRSPAPRRATSRAEPGPSVMPQAPWPVTRYSPSSPATAPSSGRPSAASGRAQARTCSIVGARPARGCSARRARAAAAPPRRRPAPRS